MNFLDPAIQILTRFREFPQTNLKLLLNRSLNDQPPEARPKTTRLVYDIIRKQHLLDTVISRFSRIRSEKIDSPTRILLVIGAHLLLYAGTTPDYAIVNEIVARATESSRGFVNGLLRNLSRRRDQVLKELETIPDPEIRHSISRLLIDDLRRISSDLESDLQYLNTEPVFHLRTNTWTTTQERLKECLSGQGIEFRYLKPFHSFEIRNPGRIMDEIINRGQGFIQNTGSQLVSILGSRLSRKRILDGCAAPGTKSMNLHLLKPELKIISNDINPKRIRLMRDFHQKCRMPVDSLVVSDLTSQAFGPEFDLILLDAPCSSSGTLRKNPDLKLKITRESLREHSVLQSRMLASLLESHPQIRILYSVCSFTEMETEAVFEQLDTPSNHLAADNGELSGILGELGFRSREGKWGVYLLPDRDLNNDLFYLALIRKKS